MEPEPLLVVPTRPRALPDLLAAGDLFEEGRPALLWLDDLARYLTVPEVYPALFAGLKAKRQQVTVLATITLTEYEAFLGATGEGGGGGPGDARDPRRGLGGPAPLGEERGGGGAGGPPLPGAGAQGGDRPAPCFDRRARRAVQGMPQGRPAPRLDRGRGPRLA